MVIFLERREYKSSELSDRISEGEYQEAMKRQIIATHHHKDKSPIHLELVEGTTAQRLQKEMAQSEPNSRQQHKKALIFSCNCGLDLLAERNKDNKIEISSYISNSSKEGGYASGDSSASYGEQQGGTVTYSLSNNTVQYGGT